VVKAQEAATGVLLSLDAPTKKMEEWAASCGFYTSAFNGQKYPRLHLRTSEQLMASVAIERPGGKVPIDGTFWKAPKAKATGHEQAELL
jgi:4-hydroxyphenylpyruvate dioxygenase-like putative hemolysin